MGLAGSMYRGLAMPVPKFRSRVERFQGQCVGEGCGEIQKAKFRSVREISVLICRGVGVGGCGKWVGGDHFGHVLEVIDTSGPYFRWRKILGPCLAE